MLRGVGIGFRSELSGDLLLRRDDASPDFVEIVAESVSDAAVYKEIKAASALWPVVPHGVKLSLGSAEGIDLDRARRLGRLARDLSSPCVTEHVSFVRAGGREIGHLTELPLTREAIKAIARNVDTLRRFLPDIPLYLENVARNFLFESVIDDGSFYTEVVEATGCKLLLDLGNLYANAVNGGLDPLIELLKFPLDRVGMIHLAGGQWQHGFYFDTHAHAVPEEVFGLLERTLAIAGDVPILLERDGHFSWPDHAREMARARSLHGQPPTSWRSSPSVPRVRLPDGERLEQIQSEVAALLTDPVMDADLLRAAEMRGSSKVAIDRARNVLLNKRVDDALPLCPFLQRLNIRAFAESVIWKAPRPKEKVAIHDAWVLTAAASNEPAFAEAAVRDRLGLSARFHVTPRKITRRALPFVARAELSSGEALWVYKGFGTNAEVRMRQKEGIR